MDLHCKNFEEKGSIWVPYDSRASSFPSDYAAWFPSNSDFYLLLTGTNSP